MKTSGKDNGIFKVRLASSFEYLLLDIYTLSVRSSGFGLDVDYFIVKDWCKERKLKAIPVYRLVKRVLNAK